MDSDQERLTRALLESTRDVAPPRQDEDEDEADLLRLALTLSESSRTFECARDLRRSLTAIVATFVDEHCVTFGSVSGSAESAESEANERAAFLEFQRLVDAHLSAVLPELGLRAHDLAMALTADPSERLEEGMLLAIDRFAAFRHVMVLHNEELHRAARDQIGYGGGRGSEAEAGDAPPSRRVTAAAVERNGAWDGGEPVGPAAQPMNEGAGSVAEHSRAVGSQAEPTEPQAAGETPAGLDHVAELAQQLYVCRADLEATRLANGRLKEEAEAVRVEAEAMRAREAERSALLGEELRQQTMALDGASRLAAAERLAMQGRLEGRRLERERALVGIEQRRQRLAGQRSSLAMADGPALP